MSTEPQKGAATAPATPDPETAIPPVDEGLRPIRTETASIDGKASSEEILDALSQVYDPEIGIDIVNLGLVYETELAEDGMLTVDMTLTSPYCPMGNIIQSQAHAVVASLPGVKDVQVNLVWQPPWDPHTMASEEARLELGIY